MFFSSMDIGGTSIKFKGLIKFKTASLSLVLSLFSRTIPLISPMCPEPMAKSLSFQSFDNSLSMLGASV